MTQSPFPGMDPYLEDSTLWQGVHHLLMVAMVDQLMPLITPKYFADFETEIVTDRIWDDYGDNQRANSELITEWFELSNPVSSTTAPVTPPSLRLTAPISTPTRLTTLQIRQREKNQLVTAIELLSPINKRLSDHRQNYLEKRIDYLDKGVHLVEIDLMRRWPRMPFEEIVPPCDYFVAVCYGYERRACDAWLIYLRQPLPVLPIPLLKPDPAVPLDLGLALRTVYERGRYDLRIDYERPTDPPLSKEDADWAARLLQKTSS
jgi:hypothetical protein